MRGVMRTTIVVVTGKMDRGPSKTLLQPPLLNTDLKRDAVVEGDRQRHRFRTDSFLISHHAEVGSQTVALVMLVMAHRREGSL